MTKVGMVEPSETSTSEREAIGIVSSVDRCHYDRAGDRYEHAYW